MTILADLWPELEVYSIDEAFLDLSSLPQAQHNDFCTQVRQTIFQYTGIPTSIGIGKTKTLAKVANNLAKKVFKCAVFNVTGEEKLLDQLVVNEVWGIGRQWTKKLMALNINTAGDLMRANSHWLKKQFSVVMMRTALELSGTRCLHLEAPAPKKSIVSSKSFGCLQTELQPLLEAISSYTARAHDKLRRDSQQTHQLSVFVQSHRFRDDLPRYSNEISVRFIHPTDDLRRLTCAAKQGISRIFKPGIHYQKIGVMLLDFNRKEHQQDDFFSPIDDAMEAQMEKLMQVLETVNRRFGRHTLKLAAQGQCAPWAMKRQLKSPNYTTSWTELLQI